MSENISTDELSEILSEMKVSNDTTNETVVETDTTNETVVETDTNEHLSSYAMLFYDGNNIKQAIQMGKILTYLHSQTIKNGNSLEKNVVDYINENIEDTQVFNEKKRWYNKQTILKNIFNGKKFINKCFIPKKFFDEKNIDCGNKTGIEIDFLVVNKDENEEETITILELKLGKDFDTKKSKGEVNVLMNSKKLFEAYGIKVKHAYITSFIANSSEEIIIKTKLQECKKITLINFMKEMFDNETAIECDKYIRDKLKANSEKNIKKFKSLVDEINNL